jgi:hypothetical protein
MALDFRLPDTRDRKPRFGRPDEAQRQPNGLKIIFIRSPVFRVFLSPTRLPNISLAVSGASIRIDIPQSWQLWSRRSGCRAHTSEHPLTHHARRDDTRLRSPSQRVRIRWPRRVARGTRNNRGGLPNFRARPDRRYPHRVGAGALPAAQDAQMQTGRKSGPFIYSTSRPQPDELNRRRSRSPRHRHPDPAVPAAHRDRTV